MPNEHTPAETPSAKTAAVSPAAKTHAEWAKEKGHIRHGEPAVAGEPDSAPLLYKYPIYAAAVVHAKWFEDPNAKLSEAQYDKALKEAGGVTIGTSTDTKARELAEKASAEAAKDAKKGGSQ